MGPIQLLGVFPTPEGSLWWNFLKHADLPPHPPPARSQEGRGEVEPTACRSSSPWLSELARLFGRGPGPSRACPLGASGLLLISPESCPSEDSL